jgi:hypothetical protein
MLQYTPSITKFDRNPFCNFRMKTNIMRASINIPRVTDPSRVGTKCALARRKVNYTHAHYTVSAHFLPLQTPFMWSIPLYCRIRGADVFGIEPSAKFLQPNLSSTDDISCTVHSTLNKHFEADVWKDMSLIQAWRGMQSISKIFIKYMYLP